MEVKARQAGKNAEDEYSRAKENFEFFEQFQQA